MRKILLTAAVVLAATSAFAQGYAATNPLLNDQGLVVRQAPQTRTSRMFTLNVASTATTETLVTLTKSDGLAATNTCSSCSVNTGKILRIQNINGCARISTGTNAHTVTVNLRAAAGGATTTASPLQISLQQTLAASSTNCQAFDPPIEVGDGFDIPVGTGNTFGLTITDPGWVTGAQVVTFNMNIVGYEY